MFSSSAGRVVVVGRPPTCAASLTTSSVTTSRIAVGRHQRRHSSSNNKTSVPPDGPGARSRVAGGPAVQQARERKSRVKGQRSGNASRKEAMKGEERGGFVPISMLYPGMPRPVGETGWMKVEDLKLMNLFAMHRPISPISNQQVIPEPVSDADFEALFKPVDRARKQHFDTMAQLNSAITSIESAAEDGVQQVEVVHLDPLDGSDPVAQMYRYRTNQPPPPPKPMPEFSTESAQAPQQQRKPRRQKGKSWQTTITVTEYTDKHGRRTFRADSSPIVRVAQQQQAAIDTTRRSIHQPFLERMAARQQRFGVTQTKRIRAPAAAGGKSRMLLISVRRQRKLKMKKHKLKKLKKRTRNLRRKLGKL